MKTITRWGRAMTKFNHSFVRFLALATGMCFLSANTVAGIFTFGGESSMISDVTNAADFNSLTHGQSLMGYEEDGLRVSVNRTYFSWDAPGLDGSEMFYANTGSLELVDISLSSGVDFNDLDMQVSSGWTQNGIGTVYLWIQLYDDGGLVGEFDLDSQSGQYVGIAGGGFDQVLIGSYATGEIRDGHTPNARNAIAIDNISAGTFVPAPGAFALFVVGGIAGMRRRR